MTVMLGSVPRLVNTTTIGRQVVADVARINDGYVVVWQDDPQNGVPGTSRILAQLFNLDGTHRGTEMVIAGDPALDFILPSVVGVTGGRFAVAFTEQDLAGTSAVARVSTFDYDGNLFATRTVGTSIAVDEAVSMAGNSATGAASALSLSYTNTAAADDNIGFAVLNATSSSLSSISSFTTGTVNHTAAGDQVLPVTAVSSSSYAATVFWDETDLNLELVIVPVAIGASGGGTTVETVIDSTTSAITSTMRGSYDILALPNGGFVVAWQDSASAPFPAVNNGLFFSIVTPDGTIFLDTEFVANGATRPTLALTPSGFAIFWHDFLTSGGVRGQVFDIVGRPLSGIFQVSDRTAVSPSATTLPDGRVVLVWGDNDFEDGSQGSIQSQIVIPNASGGNIFARGGTVIGSSTADYIFGSNLAETLMGEGGDDVLIGSEAADILYGGSGDDTLIGGSGADELYGGAGFDVASYTNSAIGVVVTIGGSGVGGEAQGDILRSIEGIMGSQAADDLRGSTGDDVLWGENGNDILQGGAGNDTLYGGAGDDVFLGGPGADWFYGGDGTDRVSYFDQTANLLVTLGGSALGGDATGDALRSIEWLTAGSGDDEIRGDAADNLIFGMDGNDILFGGAGNDDLRGGNGDDVLVGGPGADTLRGGDGSADRVSYSTSNVGISISLGNEFAATGGDAAGDVFESIERVTGSTAGDYIRGDNLANVLDGFGGNDTLNGGAGNDVLIGGAGADVFEFFTGFGNDRITDFEDGIDRLDVVNVLGATAGTLVVTLGASGKVVATFNGLDTIEFSNLTNIALITAADFIFA